MKPIEMEIWKPREDDPRRSEFVGTRSAVEVFEELRQRLDSMGLLPDESLDLSPDWRNGKPLPKDADIFVTTDYGESEGIYLDGYLRWYDGSERVTSSFFTGKTLGETGADLDRMLSRCSAICFSLQEHGAEKSSV